MQSRLYLDDLHLGQRFTSALYVADRLQLEMFAADLGLEERLLPNMDPQVGQAANGLYVAAITKKLLVEGGLPHAGLYRASRVDDIPPNSRSRMPV